MKKNVLILFSAAVVLISACENNYGNSAAKEKLAPINDSANFTQIMWLDTVRNFEPIVEGQKVDLAYRFKNVGNKPLVIEKVTASCGCTVPDPPKEPIAPGKESVITGVFDSHDKIGPNHKTLYVTANTTPRTEHVLAFNVIVNKKTN